MAVLNTKGSRVMTGLAATPSTLTGGGEAGGAVRSWVETIETGTSDSISSTYLFARLPSNARILGASKFTWDDCGTGAQVDLGTFNQSGASDVTDDPDALSNGHSIDNAGSGAVIGDAADIGLPLWSLAGASSDPKVELDIKGTLTTAVTDAAGTLTVEILYTTD